MHTDWHRVVVYGEKLGSVVEKLATKGMFWNIIEIKHYSIIFTLFRVTRICRRISTYSSLHRCIGQRTLSNRGRYSALRWYELV